MGRTGTMFAFENYNTIPDMVVIGKGLGGGIMPISALIADGDLDIAPDKALGHYTHEKSPVACAAALATIEYIQTHGLLKKSRRLGKQALERLIDLKSQHRLIGDVRGQGLMFGIELVKDHRTKIPACQEADKVMYQCLELGLSFKVSKGNFLTLTPPLTISEKELEHAFKILDQALSLIST